MNIIDPLNIKKEDLPLIVFSDDLKGFIGWAIKAHTDGVYNHVMIMMRPGYVVTQGWTYKEIPIEKYMSSRYRLKFWQIKDIEHRDILAIRNAVDDDLEASWWAKSYDWLGIVGQFLKLRGINNPKKSYCSERIANYLNLLSYLKDDIPLHPSPSRLNKIFKTLDRMKVLGWWMAD